MSQHGCHCHRPTAPKNLGIAFVLNLGFALIELGGGFFSNSVAIISDAIHDLGDCLSIALAWGLSKISQKNRTQTFSYGWKRFSLLGSLLNGFVLIGGSIFIILKTIPRLQAPEPTNTDLMFGLAVLGVVVNGLAVLKTKRGKTLNEKMINLHLLEDVWGWLAVLVGSVIIKLTDWYIIDALLALGIGIYTFWHAICLLKSTVSILLQSIPVGLDTTALQNKISAEKTITSFHDLHIWSLDGEKNIASLHIVISPKNFTTIALTKLKQKIRRIFRQHEINHVTIEPELAEEKCGLKNC